MIINSEKKENVCVVRECVYKLLGDFRLALVLEQFIYWTHKTYTYDKFLAEELERIKKNGEEVTIEKTHGWIYKTTNDLAEELMNVASRSTLSRDIDKLVELGYLEERNNPKYKWDHTKQYRPDTIKIQKELYAIGYIHPKIGISKELIEENEQSIVHGEQSGVHGEQSGVHDEQSDVHDEQTIPEITTETTSEITKELKDSESKDSHSRQPENIDWDKLAEESEQISKQRKDEMRERFAENGFVGDRDAVLRNLYEYDSDLQDIIKAFSRRWRIPPPPPKTSAYKKWIKDAREIRDMLENARIPPEIVFEEAYRIWNTPPSWVNKDTFEGAFRVSDLGSVSKFIWEVIGKLLDGKPKRNIKVYTDADGNKIEMEQ
jgi:hypothetical protein